jgi:hypothetical protein
MMVFVMNWRRGSSTGGMSRTGGGAWLSKGGVGVAEGVDRTVVVVRGDKGEAGTDVTVDKDLVIVKRGRRKTDNMTE